MADYCNWRATWPSIIDRGRPEIVVALWGFWDLSDHIVGAETLAAGSDRWNARMERLLNEAVDVLGAHDAHVVVLTTPYVFGRDPTPYDALNAVFRRFAAARPTDMSVLDITDAVTTAGPERWDTVHFTELGANIAGGYIVPDLAGALRRRVLPVSAPVT